jgi:hypothetical protein
VFLRGFFPVFVICRKKSGKISIATAVPEFFEVDKKQ